MITEWQAKSIRTMMRVLGEYEKGAIPFSQMVENMLSTMEQAKFTDGAFVRDWFMIWLAFDSVRALTAGEVMYDEAKDYVNQMKELLSSVMAESV